jgi:hypothetical protein
VGQTLYTGTFEAPAASDPTPPHVLAGETYEPGTYVAAPAGSVTVSPTGVTFAAIDEPGDPVGLGPGKQNKYVFVITDPRPPMYGVGKALDGSTGPWQTGPTLWGGVGDPIPVPSPEPTLALLLATGLVGIGFLRRKRK